MPANLTPDDRRDAPDEVKFLGSFPGQIPPGRLPEIAFVGRSNVGKSSAINTLLGRKAVARVSRTPGRTQAVNLFELDDRLCFADLPGYGFARVPPQVQVQWRAMVESYLMERTALRAVVVLVDARHPAQALDREMVAALTRAGRQGLLLVTKVDQVPRSKRAAAVARLSRELGLRPAVGFSSLERVGVYEAWKQIRALAAAKARIQGAPADSAPQ